MLTQVPLETILLELVDMASCCGIIFKFKESFEFHSSKTMYYFVNFKSVRVLLSSNVHNLTDAVIPCKANH